MNPKYNDFKTYTVRGNETVQDICMANNISESDLVQANPHISLASYGGSLFSSQKYKLDIKPGDVLKIPFYNEEKDKKGVKIIKGKSTVKVGVWEDYEVTDWYEGTPEEDRNEEKVKWDLYYMQNGTKPELILQKEEGKIRFQDKAVGNKYKVVAYLDEPNLNDGSALLIEVEASEKKEILSIKISDSNNKPINGPLAYGEKINVHVTTTGMKGEYIYITLWEDDANGEGHDEANKYNQVGVKEKALVGEKGVAHAIFTLNPDFKKIANAHLSKGDSNEGKTHEYYAIAHASGDSKASANINVRNPDYKEKRKEEIQDHLKGSKPKPSAPDYKGPVKKEEPKTAQSSQAGISAIYIANDKGAKLTKSTFGNNIRVYIASKGLKNKKVRLWLYEKDTFDPNDELYSKDIVITSDLCYENIKLTKAMQNKGNEYEIGEGSSQELFARAKVMDVPSHIFSKSLQADISSIVVDVAESTTVAKVADVKVQAPKGNSCGEKFCIKKGDKSELIREINIRLAGFGGNVPTDEFTDRTEKMIKQFQRDYMKVPETGKVCGNVLRSIDEFCSKWHENITKYKCLCHASDSKVPVKDRCGGYGKGLKDEHPGIHRSLLWGVSALKYYLAQQEKYSFNHISAGYRCWAHNKSIPRTSTNHMGKAVDIQFLADKKVISGKIKSNIDKLESIRDSFYLKYLKAQEGWSVKDAVFRLEPIGLGKDQSYSWIHMDVTKYTSYLDDKYFVKLQKDIEGDKLINIASKLKLTDLCNCGGFKSNIQQKPKEKVKYKWSHSEFGNLIAKKESSDNYNLCNKTKGGLKVVRDVDVVNTKIKDIVKKQTDRDLFAVGRYQLIPITFNAAIKSLSLDLNSNLDAETQDQIFDEYLIKVKRPKIYSYLEEDGNLSDAMYDAAKEWASIGVEKGKRISDKLVKDKKGKVIERIKRYAEGGESYYAGDGLNKAHITPEQIKNALINSKKNNK